jgi:hypothetical protein
MFKPDITAAAVSCVSSWSKRENEWPEPDPIRKMTEGPDIGVEEIVSNCLIATIARHDPYNSVECPVFCKLYNVLCALDLEDFFPNIVPLCSYNILSDNRRFAFACPALGKNEYWVTVVVRIVYCDAKGNKVPKYLHSYVKMLELVA